MITAGVCIRRLLQYKSWYRMWVMVSDVGHGIGLGPVSDAEHGREA